MKYTDNSWVSGKNKEGENTRRGQILLEVTKTFQRESSNKVVGGEFWKIFTRFWTSVIIHIFRNITCGSKSLLN